MGLKRRRGDVAAVAQFLVAIVVLAVLWLILVYSFYLVADTVEARLSAALGRQAPPEYYQVRDLFNKLVGALPYLLIFMAVFGAIAYAFRITSKERYYYY